MYIMSIGGLKPCHVEFVMNVRDALHVKSNVEYALHVKLEWLHQLSLKLEDQFSLEDQLSFSHRECQLHSQLD